MAWLFAKMRVQYGSLFDRMWSPPADAQPDVAGQYREVLETEWAQALAGFQFDNGRRLVYACERLPGRPPTLPEFKALCLACPDKPAEPPKLELAALAAPRPDPARAKADRARLVAAAAALREQQRSRSPLQWAYDLQAREAAGEQLSLHDKAEWRAALAGPAVDLGAQGFRPVPREAWPERLRAEVEAEEVAAGGGRLSVIAVMRGGGAEAEYTRSGVAP